jgi:hypothetical protein
MAKIYRPPQLEENTVFSAIIATTRFLSTRKSVQTAANSLIASNAQYANILINPCTLCLAAPNAVTSAPGPNWDERA